MYAFDFSFKTDLPSWSVGEYFWDNFPLAGTYLFGLCICFSCLILIKIIN